MKKLKKCKKCGKYTLKQKHCKEKTSEISYKYLEINKTRKN